MTTKVEQVARKLAESRFIHIGGPDSTALGKPAWVYCVPDAMIAIEAMRDPTDAMIDASCFPGESPRLQADDLTEMWNSMIQAAPNEQVSG